MSSEYTSTDFLSASAVVALMGTFQSTCTSGKDYRGCVTLGKVLEWKVQIVANVNNCDRMLPYEQIFCEGKKEQTKNITYK